LIPINRKGEQYILELKINKSDFFNKLGLGAFTCLSLFAFTNLCADLLELIFIFLGFVSHYTIWVPPLISFIAFIILLFWILNYFGNRDTLNTRKLFINTILIFIGLTVLQFLISFIQSSFLYGINPESYDDYFDVKKRNYFLFTVIGIFELLKYPILGIALLMRK
jgi:hypothetical protein